jgi:hypothetical protein
MNGFKTAFQLGGLSVFAALFIGSIAGSMTLPQFYTLWLTLIISSLVGMFILAFTVAFSK